MKARRPSLQRSGKTKRVVFGNSADNRSGVVQGGMREDNAPYFTNAEGIPWPDPAHSKTVGGLPLASDVFLFQKQQTFNRHKLLERMVHPCEKRRIRLLMGFH